MTEEIEFEVKINLPVEKVFSEFVDGFSNWWPQEYTWSQQKLENIKLGKFSGDRCTEFGPDNFQMDWGRVLESSPPEYLAFSWQIGFTRVPLPDPDQASIVELYFSPGTSSSNTVIRLIHKDFANHGDCASEYRDNLSSEYGWPFILQRFKEVVSA